MAVFRVREIAEDYDAELAPAAGPTGADLRGKAEWRRYADGGIRLSVRLRGVPLANGTVLEIRIASASAGTMPVDKGRCRYERESRSADGIVAVGAGTGIEIVSGTARIATGTFVPD